MTNITVTHSGLNPLRRVGVLALICVLLGSALVLGGCGGGKYSLTIMVTGNGSTNPVGGVHEYDKVTEVTLTATTDSGWEFDSWSGPVADATSATTTVTMDADKVVTANFSQITYTLTLAAYGNGTMNPEAGDHIYNHGENVFITATPDTGWAFSGWTGDVGDDDSVSSWVTMDGDKTVTANFKEEFDLTIAVVGPGTNATDPAVGTHTYAEGDVVVTITAIPADTVGAASKFINWTGDVDTIADVNAAITTITINGHKLITANFEAR